MTQQSPAVPHPAHQGLPPLYLAELAVWRDRWQLTVTGPGPQLVVDAVDLGPADTSAVGDPDEPGRHMIEQSPEPQPVPPTENAARILPGNGYVIDPAAETDPARRTGWTQVTDTCWTAPCYPITTPRA